MMLGLAGGLMPSDAFRLSRVGEAWTVILCSKPVERDSSQHLAPRNIPSAEGQKGVLLFCPPDEGVLGQLSSHHWDPSPMICMFAGPEPAMLEGGAASCGAPSTQPPLTHPGG